MEIIFDCFFEKTFLRLERSGLKTKQNRRNVIDHLNAVISGCCAGQDLSPEEGCRLALISVIQFHRKHKVENNMVCLMGKFHNVLYIGVKIAFDWGVTDSLIVRELLEEIYSCEKTFERIFLGAIFGCNAPYFVAGWRSDFKDQDENTRAMVYFMHHANLSCLLFPVEQYSEIRSVRFVDIPIESCGSSTPMRVALQATAPDILLIILRFGANPEPNDGGTSPIIAILDKLLLDSPRKNYLYQLISCLNIMLSCVKGISMEDMTQLNYENRKEVFIQKYGILFEDKLITKEQVFDVIKLKHLCRCTIRQILREKCKLPFGIPSLGIPIHLRRYIDLMDE